MVSLCDNAATTQSALRWTATHRNPEGTSSQAAPAAAHAEALEASPERGQTQREAAWHQWGTLEGRPQERVLAKELQEVDGEGASARRCMRLPGCTGEVVGVALAGAAAVLGTPSGSAAAADGKETGTAAVAKADIDVAAAAAGRKT